MLRMLLMAVALVTATTVNADQALPVADATHETAAEAAIQSARRELNAALANRDVQTTSRYWLPDVSTTGGDGSLWVGRDRNVAGFAEIFSDPNFVSGLRTPVSVEVGSKSAAESGTWRWLERSKGQVLTYSGRYLVMWNLVDGAWRIRSELYVTTGCAPAAGCP